MRVYARPMWRHTRGMSLIELMIVITIIAILASIAYPSYRRYVLRSDRVEATSALLRLNGAQEKFFLQQNRYAASAELSVAPPAGLGIAPDSERERYAIALVEGDALSYVARATAQGSQAEDTRCREFRIDESGRKTATDAGGNDNSAECWR